MKDLGVYWERGRSDRPAFHCKLPDHELPTDSSLFDMPWATLSSDALGGRNLSTRLGEIYPIVVTASPHAKDNRGDNSTKCSAEQFQSDFDLFSKATFSVYSIYSISKLSRDRVESPPRAVVAIVDRRR